ncbi:MAG: hypothetical protein RMJ19_00090, partial [Gemmatales bacterium]|nr:hypothetical protein [Gemmatales bacterium]MDW8174044.1 hypothetical protein [Gemmatales bacterium]
MTTGIPLSLREYMVKGVLAGGLMTVALQTPSVLCALLLYTSIVAGLVLALSAVAYNVVVRQAQPVRGRFWPFVFYLILENPEAVYGGILLGLFAGLANCLLARWSGLAVDWSVPELAGGVLLG